MLADGQSYPGAVRAVRGLAAKVWTVGYPWTKGVPWTKGAHLVFKDAAGKEVAVIAPKAPAGPPQQPQPSTGGVTMSHYPAMPGQPAGTVSAYLVHGEVGFWSPFWAGAISQQFAAAQPALGGLTEPFGRNEAKTTGAGSRRSATRTPTWRGSWWPRRAADRYPWSRSRPAGPSAASGCGPLMGR